MYLVDTHRMTDIRNLIALNIRKYRHSRGWSQTELAERAQTSPHYVGMMETKVKYPSPEMIAKLANAFGVDSTDLFKPETDPALALKGFQRAAWEDVGKEIDQIVAGKLKELGESPPESLPLPEPEGTL
jgi:transcriptional regulator with XRE-family HTH domain